MTQVTEIRKLMRCIRTFALLLFLRMSRTILLTSLHRRPSMRKQQLWMNTIATNHYILSKTHFASLLTGGGIIWMNI